MEEKIFDCIVLGGGPAGINAALYALRGNAKTCIIDTSTLGGQPVNYLEIENYLGFPSINGYELSEKFEEHLDKFNCEKFPNEEIQFIDLTGEIKIIKTLKNVFKGRTVILATGASASKLGIKGEKEYIGHGVSYCAVCDGGFYKEKNVLVIGGGNAAVEEGCYLTKFAKKVYIMHRRNELRADKIVQQRAFENEKVEFIFDSIPLEITGENNHVSKVSYKNLKTAKTDTISVEGVFPYIGFTPNAKHFSGQIMQDEKGFILVDSCMRTSELGVFAAGDVRKTPLRQVITAVSDGAVAGVYAVKYLEELKTVSKKEILSA
ncbi:MAG: FAD-dependent oxidoreductase [Candidatus Gastranaerophilales bacterium]|nr:FAD-dependent oxidoreductase [Candidatus Gastranaerophilales bacterium]